MMLFALPTSLHSCHCRQQNAPGNRGVFVFDAVFSRLLTTAAVDGPASWGRGCPQCYG